MPNWEQTKPNSMRVFLFAAILSLLLASCSRTVYVVRHAEKITASDNTKMMGDDPPLSEAGQVRALVLKDQLAGKHISHIYSTNTIRARSTAEPLSQAIKINIETYKSI